MRSLVAPLFLKRSRGSSTVGASANDGAHGVELSSDNVTDLLPGQCLFIYGEWSCVGDQCQYHDYESRANLSSTDSLNTLAPPIGDHGFLDLS